MSKLAPQQPNHGADAAHDAQAGAGSSGGSEPQRRLWRAGTLTYTAGGLAILFSWLLWGDFALSVRDRSVGPIVQLLLMREGASNTLIGVLLGTLPSAIGLILGPIVSYNSDRHRGRWGRRIPYLLFSTPVAALSLAGLAFSQPLGDLVRQVLGFHAPGGPNFALIIFGIFWIIFDFASVVTGCVFVALMNDVVPRELLGRFFGLFRIMSLAAGIIFNYWMIGEAETHASWLFAFIAIVYGVGVMMMSLVVKEGEYPPPPDVKPGERKSVFTPAKVYFKECFSKPYYLWLFVTLNVANMATKPFNNFDVLYAKSVGVSLKSYGLCVAATYCVSLSLAYFLGWLADRFHPLRLGILFMGLYVPLALWAGLYATTPRTYAFALIAHGVLAGTWDTATASLRQRLFPHSTFAQFASALGLLSAVIGMVFIPLVGAVLDLTGRHYRYTFLMDAGLAFSAVILLLVVHAKFMRLGGPEHYVAPE